MAARTSNAILVFLGSLVALSLVAVLLIWLIAAGPQPHDLESKRGKARAAVYEKLDQEAHTALTSAGWVDKAKGVVRVPVADLYAATASELKAKKPAASQVKVEPPLPMPVVDPKATEPPPPALPSAPQGADTIRFAAPEAKPSASVEPAGRTLAANPASPFTK